MQKRKYIKSCICFSLCIAFSMGLLGGTGLAETIEELQRQMEINQQNLEETQARRQQAELESQTVLETINQLDEEIRLTEDEVSQLESEIETTEKEIEAQQAALEKNQQEYEEKEELFKVRFRNMYENADISYLEVLLDCKSFSDLYYRFEIIRSIVKFDRELLEYIESQGKLIEEKKMLLEMQKSALENAKNQRVEAVNRLATSRSAKQEYMRQLYSDIERMKQAEAEMQAQSEKIAQMIKELQEAAKYAGGIMEWPAPGFYYITEYYGVRINPLYGYEEFHHGIDIAANYGENIIAANSGKVIYSGWMSGYGNTVIIDHGGGITTLYAHSSKLLVSYGDKVERGEVIALIGSTGMSTGPHLHFEVRVNGESVNPNEYLNF